MKKIVMLKSSLGADEIEGVNQGVSQFVAGKAYTVCENLAKAFLSMEVAKSAESGEVPPAPPAEQSPQDQAPESKDLGSAPENKSEKPKAAAKPSKQKTQNG